MLSRLRHILTSSIRIVPILLCLTGDVILSCKQPVDLASEAVKEVTFFQRTNGL